jgi:hypothetical protein
MRYWGYPPFISFWRKTPDSWRGVGWSKIHFLQDSIFVVHSDGIFCPLGQSIAILLIFSWKLVTSPGDFGSRAVSGTGEVVSTPTASVEGTMEAGDSLLPLDDIGAVDGTEVCGERLVSTYPS